MIYDLNALGIEALNPMQEEMLDGVRKHDSLVLLSPTGSGKTLGYMLPVVEAMQPASVPTVLVLVPSRELAIQTQGVATRLCRETKAYACYGGRPAMDEHRAMRSLSPQMVIGTPGRVLDHLQKCNFDSSQIDTLVIDEFDKSLELGFRQQMADILALLPSVRKRILLSATDSPEIPSFVGAGRVHRMDYLADTDADYADRISQYLLRSPEKDKLETLGRLLCSLGSTPSIVFLNYREAVDRVYQFLHKAGFCVSAFHGAMEQKDRERALFRFQSGCANVLVSTDLAARGLDIADVQNIIHYHLPMNSEAYIHRNGRTARWDRQGASYLILGPEETLDKLDCLTDMVEMEVPSTYNVPSSRWETLYIGRGKKDKVNKVDIVGFLSKTGGLSREQLGMVTVFPQWSFAAVERTCVPSLMARIKGQKIKGQKTIIEPIRR
ncbi:MAG: DEAD/DEAH box helicase [Bacteroidaceae bacterium]|nr:DEAD/DEAH box helicase [Bacteroidaceae bacterium]